MAIVSPRDGALEFQVPLNLLLIISFRVRTAKADVFPCLKVEQESHKRSISLCVAPIIPGVAC